MKQKREIMVVIAVANDPNRPIDADILCKNLSSDLEELLGDNFLFIEHIDDEYGEPV